jgi:hypothetical protein
VKCKAQPFVRTTVCQLRVKDPAHSWGISFAMSATFAEPDEEIVQEMIQSSTAAMKEKLAMAQRLEFSSEDTLRLASTKQCHRATHFMHTV